MAKIREFEHTHHGIYLVREYDPTSESTIKFMMEKEKLTREEAVRGCEQVLAIVTKFGGRYPTSTGWLEIVNENSPSLEELQLMMPESN